MRSIYNRYARSMSTIVLAIGIACHTGALARAAQCTEKIFVGDFNGDGLADVIRWRDSDKKWVVYLSTGGGFVTQTWSGAWGSDGPIFVGDLNGDGKTDVFMWRDVDKTWSVNLSTGSGFVGQTWRGAWGSDGPIFVGDLNGDGKADVFMWRDSNKDWTVNISNGHGFDPAIWHGDWGSDGPINVGDLNGDGKADVFMWRGDTWTVNLSTGSNWAPAEWNGAAGTDCVVVGDFTGDHRADVLMYHPASDEFSVNFSTGSGWFKWPLIGAIRWDAWIPGNDALHWVDPSIYGNYNHRRPFYGWFIAGIDDQTEKTIMDQEIDYAADYNLDYWAFDWYPELEQDPNQRKIMKPFNHYMASSKKNRIKFAFIVQSDWASCDWVFCPNGSWSLWESTFVPYFVQKFQDPQYVKVSGNRPLVFSFNDKSSISRQRLQILRDRTIAVGLGDPYIVDNNMNIDSARSHGLQSVTSYGPSGATPGTDSGRQCWQAQVDTDTANWGPHTGLDSLPGLTPVNDPRPRINWTDPNGRREYNIWVDQPTYGQWESHVKSAVDWIAQHPDNTASPGAVLIYAWNEIDEGGPGIVPTGQEGTKYLEAIKAVKTGSYPSNYVDVFNGTNCAISYSGAWTYYFPPEGVQGNYDNDENISASAGAYAEITWSSVGFEVTGTKGPNRGEMRVFIDGTSQGIIDLWSSTWQQRETLFSRLDLPPGLHTLVIAVTGQKNPASSDYQVGIDTIRAKVNRFH
jgi:hypothetical protein